MDGVDDDVLLSVLIKVPLEYPGVRVHSNLHSNESYLLGSSVVDLSVIHNI